MGALYQIYGTGLQFLQSPNSSTRSRYLSTAETYAAWLHVSGVAESGSPVAALSCSGRTPEASACFATQLKTSRTLSKSFSSFAVAIRYSACQSVVTTHGLP